mgnify:FL=1
MKINKQKDGTYAVHFNAIPGDDAARVVNTPNSVYPAFGGYDSIDAAKAFVRRTIAHRVVFIHILPRTWWVVKF